jgi:4-amino-4-deoxy-L-arabinose transferase-like glycosyltransferase
VPVERWLSRASIGRPRILLVLFCLAAWLPGVFTLPPGDRDESRFAQATKQMVETGDYVRIMNGGEARNRKPIGIHWLQAPFALAARAVGVATANPIWPYRVPSLLGGLLAVLATHELGLRLAGRRAALLAAMMLAASVLLVVEVHIAKTDAALLGATTLAMAMLARAYLAPRAAEPGRAEPPGGAVAIEPPGGAVASGAVAIGPGAAALFWLAVGAGVLLKGPITPMVAGLCVLTLLVWDGAGGRGAGLRHRASWLRGLRARWGVPLLLAVVLPWFVAIGVATHGAFFAQAVGGDLAAKLHGGDDAHGAWPGLHLLLLPLLAFPGALAILSALPELWRRRREPAARFLVAWAAPSWLVFELVPTKLPHYVLPLYPALCLAAAHWLLHGTGRPAPRWLRVLSWTGFWLGAALLGVGGAVLPFVLARAMQGSAALLPTSLHAVSFPAIGAAGWLGVPALGATALVAWAVARPSRALTGSVAEPAPRQSCAPLVRRLAAGLLAMPLLYAAILWFELPRLGALWIAPRVEATLRDDWPGWNASGRGLAAVGFAEPSLMFLAGTQVRWLSAADAAAAWARGSLDAILVARPDRPAFEAALAREQASARSVATVDGYNYSRGRTVDLTLYLR